MRTSSTIVTLVIALYLVWIHGAIKMNDRFDSGSFKRIMGGKRMIHSNSGLGVYVDNKFAIVKSDQLETLR